MNLNAPTPPGSATATETYYIEPGGYNGAPPEPPPSSESELQYAARVAGEALQRLNKTVEELHHRLQVVLKPDAQAQPQPRESDKVQRAVQSPIGSALIQHAAQTDVIARSVRDMLSRLAL